MVKLIKILDATCGPKGIWYQKNHPFVIFMDKRKGIFSSKISANTKFSSARKYNINPNVICEWINAPWPNDYFDIIVFDPPHLIIDRNKKVPALAIEYGCLYKDSWRRELKEGIKKMFDMLKTEGIFILKWCENSVKIEEIIKLCPYQPLFGSNTKSKGKTATYWILFLKYRLEKQLNIV